jgi:short-chain fatty acids transporter
MAPSGRVEEIDLAALEAREAAARAGDAAAGTAATPAERLDRSRALSTALGLLVLAAAVLAFARRPTLDLNSVNFLFLGIGLALHRSPTGYARAVAASVPGTAGIVLQFPFYGGIMALMRESGLAHLIAAQFTAVASPRALPLLAYLSSVATKLFIPSGGGEWAVEGPVMIRAAQALGAPVGKTTMGIAYGNMVGNMFQPFWAIPLLAILGLRARDIMGYCLIVFAVALPILALALLL